MSEITLGKKIEAKLEQVGFLKHQSTLEEIDAAENKHRELAAAYLESRIDLSSYKQELDKLPRIDLRQLGSELKGNQSWKVFNEKLAQLRDNPRKLSF